MKYTTRVAPAPSGDFHLGTGRTALFNYLAARASNGSFILRIDDTNQDKCKDEYITVIHDSLTWLGLTPDQYYRQSERIQLYQQLALDLVKAGLAKELPNAAIALDTTNIDLPDSFTDTIAGNIAITETNKKQIEQVILLRGSRVNEVGTEAQKFDDNYHQPIYQFASVVDDYLMGVNWIIRGTDHISNTPKQIAIWLTLQDLHRITNKLNSKVGILWDKEQGITKELPQFTHVGLIHKDNKKLSKRDNAASLLWYKEQGYSPIAILNFLLRMGWGSKEDTNQLLTLPQMIELFPKGKMRASAANYDENKLKHYQKMAGKL